MMINLTTSVHKLMEIQEKEILKNFPNNDSIDLLKIQTYLRYIIDEKKDRYGLQSYSKNDSYDNYIFLKFEFFFFVNNKTNSYSINNCLEFSPLFAKV